MAIALALICGAIWTANYAYTLAKERQSEAAAETQRVAAAAKAAAEARAVEQHIQWLNDRVTVSLSNESSASVTLWSATPTGTNADGSTIYTYNTLCTAAVGVTCSSMVYDHRGILVHGATLWSSYNANWPWQSVVEGGGR